MRQIQVGRTGNEILASSQEELRDMGNFFLSFIYSFP